MKGEGAEMTISINLMELWRKEPRTLRAEIRGYKEFKARIWIATKLIAIGCWIAQVDMKLETNQYDASIWATVWKRAAKHERFQRRAMESMVKQLSPDEKET